MITMIWKMSGMTLLHIAATVFFWTRVKGKRLPVHLKILFGVLFGGMAILSTHFGVLYEHMVLNVRDLSPLAAAAFFDPVSGITAGLIGGVHRYIAGTYLGIGAYTTMACSVSTIAAGFFAAFVRCFLMKKNSIGVIAGFFMGAVMEVFHMYAVFYFHRQDLDQAFYVVRNCSVPMILFTGIGMAGTAFLVGRLSGSLKPLRERQKSGVSVTAKVRLFLTITLALALLLSLNTSFALQSGFALQEAEEDLAEMAEDIRELGAYIDRAEKTMHTTVEEVLGKAAKGIALSLERVAFSGSDTLTEEKRQQEIRLFLNEINTYWGFTSLIYAEERNVMVSVGEAPYYTAVFSDVLDGKQESMSVSLSSVRTAAITRCGGGVLQVVADNTSLAAGLEVSRLSEALNHYHVRRAGAFDIYTDFGIVLAGEHYGSAIGTADQKILDSLQENKAVETFVFQNSVLCRKEILDEHSFLITMLPLEIVYADRNMQAYQSGLASMLLFAILYILINLVMEKVIIRKLEEVNHSLAKITNGDLDEVVDVHSTRELSALSDGINHTVDALKGYIDAAQKRMEEELMLAAAIQESALPRNFQLLQEEGELYAVMDPAREVGGDFYDFFMPESRRLVLVIADVSGKGIPAALFMMRSKAAIRSLAQERYSPSEILERANNSLCEGNDAEMFVTVWIGILDLDTGIMKCANAGHEYPLFRSGSGAFVLFKDSHDLVLGAMENMPYREYTIRMRSGDTLFVYTDGVPEANSGNMQQYGTDRLLSVLNKNPDLSVAETLRLVREDVKRFTGEAEQFDDITMLGFSYGKREAGRESEGKTGRQTETGESVEKASFHEEMS